MDVLIKCIYWTLSFFVWLKTEMCYICYAYVNTFLYLIMAFTLFPINMFQLTYIIILWLTLVNGVLYYFRMSILINSWKCIIVHVQPNPCTMGKPSCIGYLLEGKIYSNCFHIQLQFRADNSGHFIGRWELWENLDMIRVEYMLA